MDPDVLDVTDALHGLEFRESSAASSSSSSSSSLAATKQWSAIETGIQSIVKRVASERSNANRNEFCDTREMEIFSLNPSAMLLSIQDLVRVHMRYVGDVYPVVVLPGESMTRATKTKDIWHLSNHGCVDAFRVHGSQSMNIVSLATGLERAVSRSDIMKTAVLRNIYDQLTEAASSQSASSSSPQSADSYIMWLSEPSNDSVVKAWMLHAYTTLPMWFDYHVGQFDTAMPELHATKLVLHIDDKVRLPCVMLPLHTTAKSTTPKNVREPLRLLPTNETVIVVNDTDYSRRQEQRRDIAMTLIAGGGGGGGGGGGVGATRQTYTVEQCDKWVDVSWRKFLFPQMKAFAKKHLQSANDLHALHPVIGCDAAFFDNWMHGRTCFVDHPSFGVLHIMCKVVHMFDRLIEPPSHFIADLNIMFVAPNYKTDRESERIGADTYDALVAEWLDMFLSSACFIFFYKVAATINETMRRTPVTEDVMKHLNQTMEVALNVCKWLSNMLGAVHVRHPIDQSTVMHGIQVANQPPIDMPVHMALAAGYFKNFDFTADTIKMTAPLHIKSIGVTAIIERRMRDSGWVKNRVGAFEGTTPALLYIDPSRIMKHKGPMYQATSDSWLPELGSAFNPKDAKPWMTRLQITITLRFMADLMSWAKGRLTIPHHVLYQTIISDATQYVQFQSYDVLSRLHDLLASAELDRGNMEEKLRELLKNPKGWLATTFDQVRRGAAKRAIIKDFTGELDTVIAVLMCCTRNLTETIRQKTADQRIRDDITNFNESYRKLESSHEDESHWMYKLFHLSLPVHLGSVDVFSQRDDKHQQSEYVIPYRLHIGSPSRIFVCHVVIKFASIDPFIIGLLRLMTSEHMVRAISALMSIYMTEEARSMKLLHSSPDDAPITTTWVSQRMGIYWRRVFTKPSLLLADVGRAVGATRAFARADEHRHVVGGTIEYVSNAIKFNGSEYEHAIGDAWLSTILCE